MRDSSEAIAIYEAPRAHERVETDINAMLVVAPLQDGRFVVLGNISRGGVFISTNQQPQLGSRVSVRFRHVSNKECEGVGEVVWRDRNGPYAGFGVRFESINENLGKFMRTLRRLPANLQAVYLNDVIEPTVNIG